MHFSPTKIRKQHEHRQLFFRGSAPTVDVSLSGEKGKLHVFVQFICSFSPFFALCVCVPGRPTSANGRSRATTAPCNQRNQPIIIHSKQGGKREEAKRFHFPDDDDDGDSVHKRREKGGLTEKKRGSGERKPQKVPLFLHFLTQIARHSVTAASSFL